MRGRHRQTLDLRRRTLGRGNPQTLDSLCAVAGVASLRGDRGAALRHLEEAVRLGYSSADSLSQDSDFESLREDQAFLDLVERARRNAANLTSP